MNRIGILLCRVSLLLLLVAAPAVFRAIAQQSRESVPHSLISFSSEDDKFADAVPLPDCVRQLLAADDIEISALTAVRYFRTQYKFDGHSYQVAKRRSQPIGQEIPRDLSKFETRTPLVQRVGQNPETIANEAGDWLWQQWWHEKPSYLRITLYSIEGDETTISYLIRKTGQQLEVVIQTHRDLVDHVPHPGSRRPIVKDEMVVAVDVERRLALANNPDRKTVVPEDQKASPDTYELYFNDESGNNLAIL